MKRCSFHVPSSFFLLFSQLHESHFFLSFSFLMLISLSQSRRSTAQRDQGNSRLSLVSSSTRSPRSSLTSSSPTASHPSWFPLRSHISSFFLYLLRFSDLNFGLFVCFNQPFASEGEPKLVREIEEFPQYPIVHPHIDYVNTLYVYPLSVNLSKYSGTSSARNIGLPPGVCCIFKALSNLVLCYFWWNPQRSRSSFCQMPSNPVVEPMP